MPPGVGPGQADGCLCDFLLSGCMGSPGHITVSAPNPPGPFSFWEGSGKGPFWRAKTKSTAFATSCRVPRRGRSGRPGVRGRPQRLTHLAGAPGPPPRQHHGARVLAPQHQRVHGGLQRGRGGTRREPRGWGGGKGDSVPLSICVPPLVGASSTDLLPRTQMRCSAFVHPRALALQPSRFLPCPGVSRGAGCPCV